VGEEQVTDLLRWVIIIPCELDLGIPGVGDRLQSPVRWPGGASRPPGSSRHAARYAVPPRAAPAVTLRNVFLFMLAWASGVDCVTV
jgi:hypothetical protein